MNVGSTRGKLVGNDVHTNAIVSGLLVPFHPDLYEKSDRIRIEQGMLCVLTFSTIKAPTFPSGNVPGSNDLWTVS